MQEIREAKSLPCRGRRRVVVKSFGCCGLEARKRKSKPAALNRRLRHPDSCRRSVYAPPACAQGKGMSANLWVLTPESLVSLFFVPTCPLPLRTSGKCTHPTKPAGLTLASESAEAVWCSMGMRPTRNLFPTYSF